MTTVRPFRALERWIMLIASAWLVTGLQLDAYAHATTPQLETFWTPWHAVLYSGIAASGLTLLWLLRGRLPSVPTYRSVLALPTALLVPLAGMAFLLAGGGIDTLWHNIFGIETGLEIFISPSHEFIIIGMTLAAMGPALMLATRPGDRLSPADATLATISALLSALPLHIYSLHASVLGLDYYGSSENTGRFVRIWGVDGQAFHGYVVSTVLLLLPIVLVGRRWRLPIGVPTVLVAVPALAMHVMFLSREPVWWLPLSITAATAGTELVLRLVRPLVPLGPEGRWVLLGIVAPPLVWGTMLAVAHAQTTVYWNVHIVSGLLLYSAIFGVLTVLLARNVRPPTRPATPLATRPGDPSAVRAEVPAP